MCGKHCYPSAHDAAKAMAFTLKRSRRRARIDTKPGAYWCDDCRAFHWGHADIRKEIPRVALSGRPA